MSDTGHVCLCTCHAARLVEKGFQQAAETETQAVPLLQVYRVNLAEGRFLSPLPCSSPAVNACGIAPSHGLLACAGEDGVVECFDLRARGAVGATDAATAAGKQLHRRA